MTTFHEDVQRWSEEDPEFAYELALATAEESLGQQAAGIRERLGLTQAELGKLIGVRQPSVARFEGAGRTPGVETLWEFATALGCEFVIGPNFSVRLEPVGQRIETATAIRDPFSTANGPAASGNENAGETARDPRQHREGAGLSTDSAVSPLENRPRESF